MISLSGGEPDDVTCNLTTCIVYMDTFIHSVMTCLHKIGWVDTRLDTRWFFTISDLIFGRSDISIVGGADIFPSIANSTLAYLVNLSHSLSVLYWAIVVHIGLELSHVINFGV